MKLSSICLLSLGSLLLTGAPSARAAIGSISCSNSSGTTFSADVSFYDLTVTPVLAGGSGGVSSPGSGSTTTNPVVLHTPLSGFQSLALLAANGTTFSSCTLLANGLEYDLSALNFTSVQAIGKPPAPNPFGLFEPQEPTAYTQINLTYSGLRVVVH